MSYAPLTRESTACASARVVSTSPTSRTIAAGLLEALTPLAGIVSIVSLIAAISRRDASSPQTLTTAATALTMALIRLR